MVTRDSAEAEFVSPIAPADLAQQTAAAKRDEKNRESILSKLVRLSERPDLRVGATLLACFAVTTILSTGTPKDATLYQHLGAEYYNIARAIADGRGYSDPFGEATGPTAWMPPLYPTLLAALVWILDKQSWVAIAVLALTNVALAAMGASLFTISKRLQLKISPYAGPAMLLVWVVVFRYWFVILTNDVWLLAALFAAVIHAFVDYRTTRVVRVWVWGILGACVLLASPTVAIACGALVVWALFKETKQRKALIQAVALSAYIAMPWVARNAVIFGTFIPSKSNLMFEAYQANVVDADGVYDVDTMLLHPFNKPIQRAHYAKLGEIDFVRTYGSVFLSKLKTAPEQFVQRVINRLRAAVFEYHPLTRKAATGPEQLLYVLPWIGILLALVLSRRRRSLVALLTAVLLLYLTPYIVVAMYSRYIMPATPLLLLLLLLGGESVVEAARSVLQKFAPHDAGQPPGASPAS